MKVELTQEEQSEFTPINRAALDLLLQKQREGGSINPCWLCMSEDARQKAREDLISYLNEQKRPIVPMTIETATKAIERLPNMQEAIDGWKRAELSLKKEREAGNPRAYFMEV